MCMYEREIYIAFTILSRHIMRTTPVNVMWQENDSLTCRISHYSTNFAKVLNLAIQFQMMSFWKKTKTKQNKKHTHTHTRISIVHTALLRLCILPLLIEYDLQPPMLLTATWGKVKKKKKKKKKKHIREMNTEQFSDITRKKPQYEFCKQNRNQLGKKRERKRKMTLL